jgi:hypothetical protein
MFMQRVTNLAVAIALLLCSAVTHADTSVHATASFTAEYNDNILGAPDTPPPGVAGPVRAFSLQPAPGAALYHDAPRARFAITYAHPFIFYLGHPEADTSADVGTILGIFELSPTEELTAALNVNRFTTSVSTLKAANQSGAVAQPVGDSTLFNVALEQTYSREFSYEWQLLQTFGAGVTHPLSSDLPQPTTLHVHGGLGPEYRLQNHAFALLPAISYTRPFYDAPSDEVDDAGFLADDQYIFSALGRWRWDWTLSWSSEASAGLVLPFNGAGDVAVAPIWGAAIRFDQEGYGAALEYTRTMAPDLITGQTFYSDLIRLSGAMPIIASENIGIQAGTGFAWSRIVSDQQAIDSDVVNTWGLDAAIGWFPELYPQVALRYQRIQQFNAPDDQLVLPNFTRNIVGITISYSYPPRNFVVPTAPPKRVDGGDRDPLAPGGNEAEASPPDLR